jgi:acetyltransferase-like isoleucine patch superfamily enzyme
MPHPGLVRHERIPFGHLLAFGWMPSWLKCLAYRLTLGYRIGKGVHLGLGSAILGQNVRIGDHVEVGPMTIVRGRKIEIDRYARIGAASYILCEHIQIGEDAKINEQVFVGGPMLPESRFTLGARTIVMQMSFLNPTKPLEIGDDSGVGGHCLIFTHGSWLNVLEGYPVTFESVTIGKSVWLPWRVFVMPGASIGDGSVIGANSLVQGVIPPSSLAVGTPAKVVRQAPDFPAKVSPEKRQGLISEMLMEFRRYVVANGVSSPHEGSYRIGSREYQLKRVRSTEDVGPSNVGTVILSDGCLCPGVRVRLDEAGVPWLDLGAKQRSETHNPLSEELALFLSRYGIRLERVSTPANQRGISAVD